MVAIVGLIFSCFTTGYVYLVILDELYNRKYLEKKWIYYLAVLLHTILNTVEALIGYPLLNVCYSLGILCIGSALLYDTEKKDIIVNSVVIVIYVATIDFLVTTIFSTLTQNSA